jgi:hypothetical protein
LAAAIAVEFVNPSADDAKKMEGHLGRPVRHYLDVAAWISAQDRKQKPQDP